MIILFYMNELSKCRLQYNIHIYVSYYMHVICNYMFFHTLFLIICKI